MSMVANFEAMSKRCLECSDVKRNQEKMKNGDGIMVAMTRHA